MHINKHNEDAVFSPGPYTHAVTVEGGRLLFLAGQVAMDTEGNFVAEGDLAAQTRQVMSNTQAILAQFDVDFSHVVKVTIYIVGYAQSMYETIVGEYSARGAGTRT